MRRGARTGTSLRPDAGLLGRVGARAVPDDHGLSYRSIFATATYDEIRSMYWPPHEAPESKFVAIFDEMRTERAKATNLRTLREAAGLSQSQLAKASVGVRSIQLYEQRQKDINKAQGIALYRLSRASAAPWSSCWSAEGRPV